MCQRLLALQLRSQPCGHWAPSCIFCHPEQVHCLLCLRVRPTTPPHDWGCQSHKVSPGQSKCCPSCCCCRPPLQCQHICAPIETAPPAEFRFLDLRQPAAWQCLYATCIRTAQSLNPGLIRGRKLHCMIQTDNVVCGRQAICNAYSTQHNATFSSWADRYMQQHSHDTCDSKLCFGLGCVEVGGGTAQSSLDSSRVPL